MRRVPTPLLVLLLWILAAPGPATDGPRFRFGLVADVQYADKPSAGKRRYRESLESLARCVEDWREQPLAFALQLGDLIDGRETPGESAADLARVLALFSALPFPVHHVLGNHCLEVPRAELYGELELEAPYSSFRRDGLRFVVLDALAVSVCGWPPDSEPYREARRWLDEHPRSDHPNAQTWNGALGKEQLAWLEAELAAAAAEGERALVFSHLPVLAAASSEYHLTWDHAAVVDVLLESDAVVAFFSGDDHGGGYAVREGVHFVTLQGMVEADPEENAYAVVEVYADRLELRGTGTVPSRSLPFRGDG